MLRLDLAQQSKRAQLKSIGDIDAMKPLPSPFATVAVLICLTLSGCNKPVREQLKEFGYSELQPPSLLLPPGTLITLKQSDPLIVGIVCPRETAFGAGIAARVQASPSTTSTKFKNLEGTLELSADYVHSLSVDAKENAIEGISMTISNVVVEELPDDAVIDSVGKRSDGCTKAVALRRADNAKLSMVKSAIAADISYVIRYSGSVSASSKADITKKLAHRLGMSGARTDEESVSGNHLLWGLRDDATLAAYTGGSLPATGTSAHERIVLPGQLLKID